MRREERKGISGIRDSERVVVGCVVWGRDGGAIIENVSADYTNLTREENIGEEVLLGVAIDRTRAFDWCWEEVAVVKTLLDIAWSEFDDWTYNNWNVNVCRWYIFSGIT